MRRVIRRSIRSRGDGGQLVGDAQFVIAANVSRRATREAASSRSRVRAVQRSAEMTVTEDDKRH